MIKVFKVGRKHNRRPFLLIVCHNFSPSRTVSSWFMVGKRKWMITYGDVDTALPLARFFGEPLLVGFSSQQWFVVVICKCIWFQQSQWLVAACDFDHDHDWQLLLVVVWQKFLSALKFRHCKLTKADLLPVVIIVIIILIIVSSYRSSLRYDLL